MRALAVLLLSCLVPSLAAAAPCDLVTKVEVQRILRGPAVPVPADQLGEQTAPYCLWSSAGRAVEAKLEIWSQDELPVLDLKDARAYFDKLKAQAVQEGPLTHLPGVGDAAFQTGFKIKASPGQSGRIVVLKGESLLLFEFDNVMSAEAADFARAAVSRFR